MLERPTLVLEKGGRAEREGENPPDSTTVEVGDNRRVRKEGMTKNTCEAMSGLDTSTE